MKLCQPGLWLLLFWIFGFKPVVAQPRPIPVVDDQTPIEIVGALVKPPGLVNWFLVERTKHGVIFFKRPEVPLHSFYVAAMVGEFPLGAGTPADFFEQLRNETKARSDGKGRFRAVRFEFGEEVRKFGARCARYGFESEDHAARGAGDKVLILAAAGYVCIHPQRPNLYLDVHYSERGGPQPKSDELRLEGEDFLEKISFIP